MRPDELFGDRGNDYLSGDQGDDLLRGDEGNDVLVGGAGDDLLIGEQGADQMYGGLGRDTFFVGNFSPVSYDNFDTDFVGDFNLNMDVLRIQGFLGTNDFSIVTTDALAATAENFFAYSLGSGTLFLNANRNESGFGATNAKIATLFGAPQLTIGNFAPF